MRPGVVPVRAADVAAVPPVPSGGMEEVPCATNGCGSLLRLCGRWTCLRLDRSLGTPERQRQTDSGAADGHCEAFAERDAVSRSKGAESEPAAVVFKAGARPELAEGQQVVQREVRREADAEQRSADATPAAGLVNSDAVDLRDGGGPTRASRTGIPALAAWAITAAAARPAAPRRPGARRPLDDQAGVVPRSTNTA